MRNMNKHFDLVNNSTYIRNLNTGGIIDPTRHSLKQTQKDMNFKKIKANDSNFIAEQTSPQSNNGRLK